jgi:hypothetical protein
MELRSGSGPFPCLISLSTRTEYEGKFLIYFILVLQWRKGRLICSWAFIWNWRCAHWQHLYHDIRTWRTAGDFSIGSMHLLFTKKKNLQIGVDWEPETLNSVNRYEGLSSLELLFSLSLHKASLHKFKSCRNRVAVRARWTFFPVSWLFGTVIKPRKMLSSDQGS